ncbi:hypothetical protein MRB53_028086 [Persea americana]|uniref:Uncharacterized protein n=1 Tax=Persea americana TaxID=3435 RepID=A0ACC2KEJ1_PERAE|nr:hypothetical protein MRB53_028086 [Persea americana]
MMRSCMIQLTSAHQFGRKKPFLVCPKNGVPDAAIWHPIDAQGRPQASLPPRRSVPQKHRRLQAALRHHSHFTWTQWYERDGH